MPGCARIWVKTFGCAHNQSDGEFMAGQLQAYGYNLVDDGAAADLWLINTCACPPYGCRSLMLSR